MLGLVFVMALGVIPLALCAGAAGLTGRLAPGSGLRVGMSPCVTHTRWCRSAPASGWRTTASTSSPASAPSCRSRRARVIDATGRALLGAPDWGWLGMRAGAVFPLQMGATLLGAFGSIALVHRIAARDHHGRATRRRGRPGSRWSCGLTALALWIFAQPMEMRADGARRMIRRALERDASARRRC